MWEEGRTPPGCLPTTLGTNPRAGPLGSWAPPRNRDTLLEASSNSCMAMTKRVPKREHSMDTRQKPRAPHRCFGSGSSDFWSHPSSSPPRRTPSLRQEQQREGERETGAVKRWKGWEMQGGRGRGGGGSGCGRRERVGVKGEREREGGREAGTVGVPWEGGGVGGGEGGRSPRLGLSVKPQGDPCRSPENAASRTRCPRFQGACSGRVSAGQSL